MNKKTIKAVERRILTKMMATEFDLKSLLNAETNNAPDNQIGGLITRVEQLLGKIVLDQNKLILLQDIKEV